jgi:hypothetical protein
MIVSISFLALPVNIRSGEKRGVVLFKLVAVLGRQKRRVAAEVLIPLLEKRVHCKTGVKDGGGSREGCDEKGAKRFVCKRILFDKRKTESLLEDNQAPTSVKEHLVTALLCGLKKTACWQCRKRLGAFASRVPQRLEQLYNIFWRGWV